MLVLLHDVHRSGVSLRAAKGCLVGSWAQWRASVDGGDLRRVTWVCGDQHVLIEEVVDTVKDKLNLSPTDYVSLSLCPTFERDVWAAANQYPLTPGSNRMVLIRDAEKLSRWNQLDAWLTRTRSMPGVYLMFVSNEPDLPTHTQGGKKVLKPHVAALRAPRGSLVRCTMPAVCAKLRLFEQAAGAATINALVAEAPAADFTDSLIALDKRTALLSLPGLADAELISLIALLDSRLDLLERLHRIQIAGRSWRDASGVNPFLLRQYMPHARHYDSTSCTRRRRVLAVVDDALRTGARDGVFEALTALW
jgi:DNA polymerase III delta subunit